MWANTVSTGTPQNVGDYGYVAYHASADRLFVTDGADLYRINGASSGAVGAGLIAVSMGHVRMGPVWKGQDGFIYATQRVNASNPPAIYQIDPDTFAETDLSDDAYRVIGNFPTSGDTDGLGNIIVTPYGCGILTYR